MKKYSINQTTDEHRLYSFEGTISPVVQLQTTRKPIMIRQTHRHRPTATAYTAIQCQVVLHVLAWHPFVADSAQSRSLLFIWN